MPPTPPPAPLAPVPLEWWQNVALFSPAAVLLAALVAALINWRILKQRTRADNNALEQRREADRNALDQKTAADSRAEWWRRAQWALERALSEDEATKALGLATLEVLAHSELARKEELELFDIAWKTVNGSPEADDAGDQGSQSDRTVRIVFPRFDESDVEMEAGSSVTEEDILELGEYLRHHAVLQTPDAVDSGDNMGDNEGTDPRAQEEDRR
ncbi:hypothetical protein SAMN04487916_108155 [Arthrobacter sp. ov407]|uniref:hypothetical protein n=1 Tax=Arthrobacter sp. ov407 TaxID=1761748 RepID=UPI000883C54C|nr:hypothetical protein [Arthrobacter sp. ov407]SDL38997.1 hypothetical protein SAMN04487916_108155 [Arthrobacter sp. ov407]